jgi:hypothetical protein
LKQLHLFDIHFVIVMSKSEYCLICYLLYWQEHIIIIIIVIS